MYQALYRKYRPKCFSDVTGQEHITQTLRSQVISGRLSHAYLFVGTRGTGKTTCAKILSRAVNCLALVNGDPCNKCMSCIGIESGSILDVLELDAASNNGVDNVRALRDEAIYTPASVNKRVYIIDEVHMLSTAAFNALLKILEEPPEHLMFILATTDRHKVPATILSRCQRFSFKRLSQEVIEKRISLVAEKEGLNVSPQACEKLASMADGSLRDGLSLLDQCASSADIDLNKVLDTLGLTGQQDLVLLFEAAAKRDPVAALSKLDVLYQEGRDMASLLSELSALMRDVLVFKLSADSPLLSGGYARSELAGLSELVSVELAFANMDILRDTSYGLSRSGSTKLSVEMCLIRMCDVRLMDDAAGILARLSALENGQITASASGTQVAAQKAGEPKTAEQNVPEQQPIEHKTAAQSIQEPQPIEEPPHENDVQSSSVMDQIFASEPVFDDIPFETIETDESLSTAPADYDVWQSILKQLEHDPSIYFSLNDESEISAVLKDNSLIVSARNPFSVVQIESEEFTNALKDAALKVLGKEILVKAVLDESEPGESKHDKLENLVNQFSNVNFE